MPHPLDNIMDQCMDLFMAGQDLEWVEALSEAPPLPFRKPFHFLDY